MVPEPVLIPAAAGGLARAAANEALAGDETLAEDDHAAVAVPRTRSQTVRVSSATRSQE